MIIYMKPVWRFLKVKHTQIDLYVIRNINAVCKDIENINTFNKSVRKALPAMQGGGILLYVGHASLAQLARALDS